ncbi:MAG: PTS sugar transporter subunit IIA [Bifidobacteriaceae bacterium]|jgi:PTS system N-acetylgalactosamine-specific IIA component|nr:PTS sugar transporter subunit IIA [Bifidobacteriaceae bacterium]
MYGVIITGHGEFPIGLRASAEMIAGEQDKLATHSFIEGASFEAFEKELAESIKKFSQELDGVLIFADLLGGSPFRAAMSAAHGLENARVITGANSPMLLECLVARDGSMKLKDLLYLILETGKEGILSPVLELDSVYDADVTEGDGI